MKKWFIALLLMFYGSVAWAANLDVDVDSNDALDLVYGGTNTALTDPGADTLLGWDDTDGGGAIWFTIGAGLTYTHATHTLSASGSGDVTGVGDCADGVCLDGSSDGGTYIRLYDGDSHYTQFSPGNSSANLTWTFPTAYPAGTYLVSSTNGGVLGTVDPASYQAASATLASLAGLTETNGGIPYGTADNTYAWLAAGATGKVLIAKGAAAPEWTPYTFPATVPTVGKVLISDGTNLIGSTALGTAAYTASGDYATASHAHDADVDTLSNMPHDLNISIIPNDSYDNLLIKRFNRAVTFSAIGCMVDPADSDESVVLDIYECDSNGDNCASSITQVTCLNAPTAATVNDGAFDANDFMKITLGTITGTVSSLIIYGTGKETW